jgi:hypothetical protein
MSNFWRHIFLQFNITAILRIFNVLFGEFGVIRMCLNVNCVHRWLNPLNAELNPICHLLTFLGAHPIFHISRIRVNKLCNS